MLNLYQHIKYPGYYIDLDNSKVYSIKSGMLKELKYGQRFTSSYNGSGRPVPKQYGWTLSHHGKSRFLNKDDLLEYCDLVQGNTDLFLPVTKHSKK